MNPFALSGLLTGVTSLAFGYFVYLKGKTRLLNRLWFLFTASVAVWGLGGMWIGLARTELEALWAWRLAFACGVLWIPILFYHFVCVFCGLSRRKSLVFCYSLSALFFPLIFTDMFFSGVRLAFSSFYYSRPGPFLFPFFVLWWIGMVVYSHYELLRAYADRSGQQRNRIKYFFLATAIGYSGGSLDYLPIFGIDLYPYGNFAIVLYPIIMTYAIVKYRLMDITAVMEKGLTYLLLLIVVAVPSYPLLLVAQQAFFGTVSHAFSILMFLLFALVTFMTYRFKPEAQVAVARTLFRQRYDMYQTLSEFSTSLVTRLDLRSITEEIVRRLVEVMGIRTASLYLLDHEKDLYLLAASHGLNVDSVKAPRFMTGDWLPHYLASSQAILVREELEHVHGPRPMEPILEALRRLGSEVCIPLVNKDRLIGFCNLGPRAGNQMYSVEDLNLLTALAQNAAIALDNARLYEELKHSQSLMRRTDRLRSLETIAGGFAHEIRNPLTSIKTFIQLVPERKDDPDFIGPFTRVVAEDLQRIERLIQEILDYARYMEPQLSDEDLNEIVASCLYFVEVKADSQSIAIEKDLAPDLPRVRLDRQQIKQVLLNLFLNAMEAMNHRGGQLTVKTHRLIKPAGDSWVQVEVGDTGAGISTADLEHIFDPFYTTKHESAEREGTGLGLTIAHQIVQEHGGTIEVHSTVEHGTTFFVNLPVNPVPSRRTTAMARGSEEG